MTVMLVKRNIAVKYRAYPTTEQARLIDRTIGCARFIYNLMLETRINHYKATGKSVRPTPAQYKDEYPFLREVDSMALCNAQINLEKAYNAFFRQEGRSGFPKFKSKRTAKLSYTTNSINGSVRLDEGGKRLKLPKVGWVRVRQHKTIPGDWRIKSVTVEHCRTGHYEATILFEYETQAPEPVAPTVVTGLDYSSRDLFVTSDGHKPGYPRFYRQTQDKLAREQRKLSRMVKGSNNWVKQKQRVARLSRKTARQRADWLHKTANDLAASSDCIVVEDLNMRAIAQGLKLGKSTMDNAYGMLLAMLDYKLAWQGKQLVVIDKFYPSTQTCHVCGYRNKETKNLAVRSWICPSCGSEHDRDINAALNIRQQGISQLQLAKAA